MASRLDALTAQVAELTALVEVLATQGASVTVTETKPKKREGTAGRIGPRTLPKKTRKTKAKAPVWNYYAIGKEAKTALRNDLKDLLREICEDEGDFVGWTWNELRACADDCDVDYSHLIG